MDEITQETLLAQFRAFLETHSTETVMETASATTDLFALFTELAALRSEVKHESRQFKTTIDQFKSALTVVESQSLEQSEQRLTEQFSKTLERYHAQKEKQQREAIRGLLLEFLEMYDRIEAGLDILKNYSPTKWLRSFSQREIQFIGSLMEGQAITLHRLEQLLARYRVYPFEVLHKPLDPHCMRALETGEYPQLDNGIVTEELRRGFRWEDEILRPAEVKVNKKSSTTSNSATTGKK
ncbi:MAG: nucleotide exchange factor GrpE [Beggiatoa sp. IS2]|nr:MAG: nucleotide exchange factor GrpE [Beggiatoa sp. IS2]